MVFPSNTSVVQDSRLALSNAPRATRRRCFVGFFGLNRSLRWTAPSIRRNVIDPLRAADFDCFLAAHFNQPAIINHPQSGERSVKLRRSTIKNLEFDLQWIEPQSEANIADMLEPAMAVPFRDYPDPSGGTRRNILYQMHSLRRVSQMLELAGPDSFDVFLLLRPDIEYIDSIDLAAIEAIANGSVDMVTPSWQQWGGLNDRFAFCNRKAAEVFLRRGDRIRAFCEAHQYIHPETLLGEAIADANLRVITTEQRALRVRATGETWVEGFELGKITRVKHRARPLLTALTPA